MPPVNDGESDTKQVAGEAPPVAEQDDDLWNEVASGRDDPPADDAAGTERDPAEQDDVDAKPGSKDSGENEEAAGAKSDPPASEASSDDIWANAPPELKAAHDADLARAEHRFNTVKGRLSVQDRLLDALRNGSPGSGQGGKSKVKALLESDEFKTLREEYGTNLKPMISAVEALAERQDNIDGAVDQADEERSRAHIREQLALYAQDHPDWESYGDDQRFDPWLQTQPRHIREAAARNSQVIVDAGEASDVMARFKAAHGIGATPTPTPTPTPTKDTSEEQRRNRQRDGARGSGFQGGPAATATDPEDPEALWDTIASKRDRQRQQR